MEDRKKRFEEAVMPHLDAAANLARWLARDGAWADDIVQDAMLRAFKSLHTLRGADAKPWLMQIVRNCFRSAASARKTENIVPLPERFEEPDMSVRKADDPESAAIAASAARRLDALIESLPLEFRETLILREMEDFSYREIAEVTKVPIGTVMSRLARARALLRAACTKDELTHGMQ